MNTVGAHLAGAAGGSHPPYGRRPWAERRLSVSRVWRDARGADQLQRGIVSRMHCLLILNPLQMRCVVS